MRKILINLIRFSVASFFLFGCKPEATIRLGSTQKGGESTVNPSSSTPANENKNPTPETKNENPAPPPTGAALSPNIGVKNFRSIYASMGAVTGASQAPVVNGAANPIVTDYNRVQTQLSADGDAMAVSSSQMLATGVLAGDHCRALVTSAAASTTVNAASMFKKINFAQNETQFTPALSSGIISDVTQSAWQRMPTAEETVAFTKAIQDTIAGATTKNIVGNTQSIALVLCSGALGSLQFFKN